MFKKPASLFALVGALGLLSPQTLLADDLGCPQGASGSLSGVDGEIQILLLNPAGMPIQFDGTVGICSTIRLSGAITWHVGSVGPSSPRPAFEGGEMHIVTVNSVGTPLTFDANVTPIGGVTKTGPVLGDQELLTDAQVTNCIPLPLQKSLSSQSVDFSIADAIARGEMDANRRIRVQFRWGPDGTIMHTDPHLLNLAGAVTPGQIVVAPAPTCAVGPNQSVCEGSPASFTVTATGAGPFTFCWKKNCSSTPETTGCITANVVSTATTSTLSFPSAQAAEAGCYKVTVTDFYGCSVVCSNTLTVKPNPTCMITGPTGICELTTNTYTSTVSPIGGVVTHSWSIIETNIPHRAVIVGPIDGPTVKVGLGDSHAVTNYYTLVDTITRDGCPGVCMETFSFVPCRPGIHLTKRCSVTPTAPGGITTFSGIVSNSGNVTLTNVIVVNDQPAPNTLVTNISSLPAGAAVSFSDSYRIPPNCCTHVDTLRVTAVDERFGQIIATTATAVCPTLITPKISVTKECPPGPTPLGQPLVFSGIVSNAGDITLTNVTVVNNQPSINTPVFGPVTLAPGEIAFYSGSYIVPINICDSTISDTVTASGNNICNGNSVTDTRSAQCAIIPTPRLSLTKNCPANPVPPGGLLAFSGTVSNSGTVTITNIVVVNDQPTNNTPVIGPITLAPGQSANFTGSYRVCPECCPPYVDTLTATGNEYCKGSNVIATATASCPGISSPSITVTKDFCDPAQLGQLLFFSGTISNAGDVALQNITVSDDHAGTVAQNITLAPGESVGYLASYTPTNCGPSVLSTVTVTATDSCTGQPVGNNITAGCPVTCSSSIIILNPRIGGSNVLFSLATQSGVSYTIQYTPSLSPPANWQVLTNVVGNGATVDIQDSKTQTQRFYRVSSP